MAYSCNACGRYVQSGSCDCYKPTDDRPEVLALRDEIRQQGAKADQVKFGAILDELHAAARHIRALEELVRAGLEEGWSREDMQLATALLAEDR